MYHDPSGMFSIKGALNKVGGWLGKGAEYTLDAVGGFGIAVDKYLCFGAGNTIREGLGIPEYEPFHQNVYNVSYATGTGTAIAADAYLIVNGAVGLGNALKDASRIGGGGALAIVGGGASGGGLVITGVTGVEIGAVVLGGTQVLAGTAGLGIMFAKASKSSGKEKANNPPSWAKSYKQNPGESGNNFAKRIMDEQYGKEKWSGTGVGSEYSKIRKWGDRGGHN